MRDEFSEIPRSAAFVCDDSSSSARIAALYSEFKRDNPGLAEFLAGLVHQDDKKCPPLQTADMMAHLAKYRFIKWLDDPRRAIFTSDQALRARLKRLNVHHIAAWNEEYMLKVLDHIVKKRGLKPRGDDV